LRKKFNPKLLYTDGNSLAIGREVCTVGSIISVF